MKEFHQIFCLSIGQRYCRSVMDGTDVTKISLSPSTFMFQAKAHLMEVYFLLEPISLYVLTSRDKTIKESCIVSVLSV